MSDLITNIREIIASIGDDPDRDGLLETPARVAKMYEAVFSGYKLDPASVFKVFDSDGYEGLVLVKNIEFFSHCEHHMVPFYGKASIAYIPNGKIIGLSKLARLVEIFSKRLQVQERITKQLADTMQEHLNPKGVAVYVDARHMCMCMRGVQKQLAKTVTTSYTGIFLKDQGLKDEFLGSLEKK
jgi:GTP cyclohydrolase IA